MGDASKRQVKFFDREIKRCGDRFWNHVEPHKLAIVYKVNSNNTVNIEYTFMNSDPIKNVPVMLPANSSANINLSEGDTVVVGYMDGTFNAPFILGKIG